MDYSTLRISGDRLNQIRHKLTCLPKTRLKFLATVRTLGRSTPAQRQFFGTLILKQLIGYRRFPIADRALPAGVGDLGIADQTGWSHHARSLLRRSAMPLQSSPQGTHDFQHRRTLHTVFEAVGVSKNLVWVHNNSLQWRPHGH